MGAIGKTGLAVLGFEDGHEAQVAPVAIALGGFAHDSLVLKPEALVEMTGAGVVVVDVEEHPVCAQFPEGNAHQFFQDAATDSSLRHGHDEPLKFDGPRGLLNPAQDCVGLDFAPLGLADVVAGVAAGEGSAVAFLAPLADEFAGHGGSLEGEHCRDVVEGGEAKRHRG